jgi:hypothetical protein
MTAALALPAGPDRVEEWIDRIASMPERGSPCRGCTAERWRYLQPHILRSLETHKAALLSCAFSVHDLFGVHHSAGMVRIDACGILTYTPRPKRIVQFSNGSALLANGNRMYPPTAPHLAVAIWAYEGPRE